MAVSGEYRIKAAEFRAKADSLRDPLFSSMFYRLSKTYSQLAKYAEETERKSLAYELSPPVAADQPKP